MQRSMIITREETRGVAVSEAPALCFPIPSIALSLSHQYLHPVPIGEVSTRMVNQGNNEACAAGEPFKRCYSWGLKSASVCFNFLKLLNFLDWDDFLHLKDIMKVKLRMLFNSSFPTDLFISSPNLFVFLVYELETSFFIPTANQGKAVTYTQQTLNGWF